MRTPIWVARKRFRPRRGPGSRTAASGSRRWPATGPAGASTGCRFRWTTAPPGTPPPGRGARLLDVVRGADNDSAASLAAYRRRAAQMAAALPGAFFVKPASAEQIWWHWNYTASRGVWRHPLPCAAVRPARPAAVLGVHPGVLRPGGGAVCGAGGGGPRAATPRCSCGPTATAATRCPTRIRR